MRSDPQEQETKAREVSAMFARIARRYDLMNTLMTAGRHHRWRRLAVRLVQPPAGGVALDVGCGTGDLAIELARHRLKSVVGVDFSAPMVELGRQKVTALRLSHQVHLGLGDALNLPFPDGAFDSVATAFTLRNVSNLSRALEEIRRVTRPGGRVVSLEITPGERGLVPRLFHLGFQRLVPILGAVVARDRAAYTYLPNSVGLFFSAAEIARLMEQVGFQRVWFRRLALGTVAIHVGEV